jgi:hypothetical protein
LWRAAARSLPHTRLSSLSGARARRWRGGGHKKTGIGSFSLTVYAGGIYMHAAIYAVCGAVMPMPFSMQRASPSTVTLFFLPFRVSA